MYPYLPLPCGHALLNAVPVLMQSMCQLRSIYAGDIHCFVQVQATRNIELQILLCAMCIRIIFKPTTSQMNGVYFRNWILSAEHGFKVGFILSRSLMANIAEEHLSNSPYSCRTIFGKLQLETRVNQHQNSSHRKLPRPSGCAAACTTLRSGVLAALPTDSC